MKRIVCLTGKFGWGFGRKNDVIDRLFNASRVNVFTIDENQFIPALDDLIVNQINEYAQKNASKIIEDDTTIASS